MKVFLLGCSDILASNLILVFCDLAVFSSYFAKKEKIFGLLKIEIVVIVSIWKISFQNILDFDNICFAETD
jgi:hypothetical protein